jgi:lipopolysaccharide transport system permease protein
MTQVFEVTGGRTRPTAASLRELWAFRDVLLAFAQRRHKIKYKHARIGIGWAILQPLASAAIFAIIFGHWARLPSDGVDYVPFALTGMVGWTYFVTAAGTATESLIDEAPLLRKVYFPREVVPLAAVAAALVDLLPALLVAGVVAVSYGATPAPAWLLLPLPLALLVMSAAVFGLAASGLNVYYRDLRYAIPFLMQLGLFASAVVYPLSLVPGAWETALAVANPVAAAIDAMRDIMLHGRAPDLLVLAVDAAWLAVACGLVYWMFKRLERGFSDWA